MGEKPTEADEADARKLAPDRPAGIAVSDPGVPADKAGSKREGAADGGPDEPAEATSFNSSKSNIYRQVGPGGEAGDTPLDPAEGTINTTRSNTFRQAGPGGGSEEAGSEGQEPDSAQATTVKSSKSNSSE